MDIWEANANATALTPHPCIGDTCDKGGCGFNPYAQGKTSYYANGGTVDTLQPMTVITQFYTNDNTTTGTLVEIRRLYIQNGKIIQNAVSSSGLDSITASWCDASDASAASLGGLKTMGEALGRGMVLVLSIWNDNSQFMNWLDSGSNGPCSSTAGDPAKIQAQTPEAYVTLPAVFFLHLFLCFYNYQVLLYYQILHLFRFYHQVLPDDNFQTNNYDRLRSWSDPDPLGTVRRHRLYWPNEMCIAV
ncbi:Endoglucanase EG-1 protein [Rutstroemia sp. NJR-2017a BBW]|nr:Endoglucanase EG-1 protein [Rutstroemia sp. NJR-2017a BBW]